jgi:hypothetical protein
MNCSMNALTANRATKLNRHSKLSGAIFRQLTAKKDVEKYNVGSRGIAPLILTLGDWMEVSGRPHVLVTLLSGLASPMFVWIEGW